MMACVFIKIVLACAAAIYVCSMLNYWGIEHIRAMSMNEPTFGEKLGDTNE